MICLFYQRMISRSLDANGELSARTLRHIEHCAICSGFYEAQARVIHGLAAGTDAQRQSPSPFLHHRVMAELAREQQSLEPDKAREYARPTKSGANRVQPAWTLAAAAACLLLALFVWRQNFFVEIQPVLESKAGTVVTGLTSMLKLPDGTELRELSSKFDSPLETELQLVVNDARTALNYLANDLLPEPLRASAFGGDQ